MAAKLNGLNGQRRATLLLLGGVLSGLLLAAADALQWSSDQLPDDIVARIGAMSIERAAFNDVLSMLESQRDTALVGAERRRLLMHMIDERLLLEQGVALGLLHADTKLRRELITAVSDWVTREASLVEPDDDTLRAFYRDNVVYFSRNARYRVQQLRFVRSRDGQDSAARAQAAHAALRAGQSWDAIAQRADEPPLPIPDTFLAASKLRGYIGPTLLSAAVALPVGGFSAPLAVDGGHLLLALIDKREAAAAAWETLRELVRHEYRRRAVDDHLREYLDALKRDADIVIARDIGS